MTTPVTQNVLFLGGSHDGARYPVSSDTNIVKIAHSYARAHDLLEAILDSGPIGEAEVYQRFVVTGLKYEFSVFAPSQLTIDEVLAWLIGGYAVCPDESPANLGESTQAA